VLAHNCGNLRIGLGNRPSHSPPLDGNLRKCMRRVSVKAQDTAGKVNLK
jgi:hypothetical protein